MSKLDDSVLTPELGHQVLQVLSRHQALPEWGLLAGQSVASAIDEILGTGLPVYNDIDWFVPVNDWTRDDQGRSQRYLAPDYKGKLVGGRVSYTVTEEVESDGYSRTIAVAERALYSIDHAENDRLLNKVAVNWAWSHRKDQNKPLDLIRVFDTNNVQAAVDLETGQLTVSPAYRDFFRTRQLKLVSVYTPVQSLMRFLKKADELKGSAYADRDRAVDLISRMVRMNEGPQALTELRRRAFKSGAPFLDKRELHKARVKEPYVTGKRMSEWVRAGEGLYDAPLSFGRKYLPYYERFADFLDPVFQLTERKQGKLWLCTGRTDPKPSTFALGQLHQFVNPNSVARFHEEQSLPVGKLVGKRRELFELFMSLVNEDHKKTHYFRMYGLLGDAFLDGFDSERAARELARVVDEHTEFFWAAVALPLARQIEAMRTLRRYFKQYDLPEAWGVLRTVSSNRLETWLIDEGLIVQEFKALEGTKEPYVPAMPLLTKVGNVEVHECLSQYDLNREGTKMGHCVAGYGSSVQTRRCRIVSFRSGPKATDWATAEWVFDEDKLNEPLEDLGNDKAMYPLKTRQIQLRSHANTAPAAHLKEAEETVRAAFDAWLVEQGRAAWEFLKPGSYEQMKADRTRVRKPFKAPTKSASGFDPLADDIEF